MQVELYVGYIDYTWDVVPVDIDITEKFPDDEEVKQKAVKKFTDSLDEETKETISFVGLYNYCSN